MRTTIYVVLTLIFSIGVGSAVSLFTSLHYAFVETQGPFVYSVKYGEGGVAEDLGVEVTLNLSFAKTWFIGEEKNVTFEASAEEASGLVHNVSWRIFSIRLYTVKDGKWENIVAFGSLFLNESETSDTFLYKHQDISVSTANLNLWESVDTAWFRIGIMMGVFHNDTEYSFTFYTPRNEIGPVAVLSPLYSPISLATIATATTALCTTLPLHLLRKNRALQRMAKKDQN